MNCHGSLAVIRRRETSVNHREKEGRARNRDENREGGQARARERQLVGRGTERVEETRAERDGEKREVKGLRAAPMCHE